MTEIITHIRYALVAYPATNTRIRIIPRTIFAAVLDFGSLSLLKACSRLEYYINMLKKLTENNFTSTGIKVIKIGRKH